MSLSSPHDSRRLLLQPSIRCYDEPSVGGLAPRTLNVLLGTGALLTLAPVPVLETGQALPKTAEPVPWAPRAALATNRHEE